MSNDELEESFWNGRHDFFFILMNLDDCMHLKQGMKNNDIANPQLDAKPK